MAAKPAKQLHERPSDLGKMMLFPEWGLRSIKIGSEEIVKELKVLLCKQDIAQSRDCTQSRDCATIVRNLKMGVQFPDSICSKCICQA